MKFIAADSHKPAALLPRALLAGLWLGSLVIAIWLLGILGHGALSTPPLLDRSSLQIWLETRDAVTMGFALIRLSALGLAWYLLIATLFGLLARASRLSVLIRISDSTSLSPLRQIVSAIAGVGLSASIVSLTTVAFTPPGTPSSGSPSEVVLTRIDKDETVRMTQLRDGSAGSSTLRVAPAGDSTMRVIEEPKPVVAQADLKPQQATWEVSSGDSFWTIAERALTECLGRSPSADEISQYWKHLIELNRNALSDRENPDLILPGQIFVLPD